VTWCFNSCAVYPGFVPSVVVRSPRFPRFKRYVWAHTGEDGTSTNDGKHQDWIVDVIERVDDHTVAFLYTGGPQTCNELAYECARLSMCDEP
jgi:hypothetical protein